MSSLIDLKRTPLFETHSACKAKLVDFGGWHMPVQYTGILDEHNAVRHGVGLFDVSHMGEIRIAGPQALDLVNWISTNDAGKLQIGQAHYSALLYEHGGFVDDILVHKVSENDFFLCVNSSNQEKDLEHICSQNTFDCEVEFVSNQYAQLAVQGPKALDVVAKLTKTKLEDIRYYWFADGAVGHVPARIARTGYTGEDGFELYIPAQTAGRIWEEVLLAGEEYGIRACGLGARNTLRLEAKMALYGHEITATINPFEADLAWIVKMGKGDFVGRRALETATANGVSRKLVGFEMLGRGIGRDGYEVWIDDKPAGWVTSGGPAPTLNKNIGLCYLPADKAVPGTPIQIMIRNTPVDAITVATPFYKRAKV